MSEIFSFFLWVVASVMLITSGVGSFDPAANLAWYLLAAEVLIGASLKLSELLGYAREKGFMQGAILSELKGVPADHPYHKMLAWGLIALGVMGTVFMFIFMGEMKTVQNQSNFATITVGLMVGSIHLISEGWDYLANRQTAAMIGAMGRAVRESFEEPKS